MAILLLTTPVALAILLCFFEFWYLSEEMLVVASVILFLTILVQSLGTGLSESLIAPREQLLNRLQKLGHQCVEARVEYNNIDCELGFLKFYVRDIVAAKFNVYNGLVNSIMLNDVPCFLNIESRVEASIESANNFVETTKLLTLASRATSTILEAFSHPLVFPPERAGAPKRNLYVESVLFLEALEGEYVFSEDAPDGLLIELEEEITVEKEEEITVEKKEEITVEKKEEITVEKKEEITVEKKEEETPPVKRGWRLW
jgi:hypothetical protein